MRCANCTTELWGNPESCPVCGKPTGLTAPRDRRARTTHPAAPEPAAPPQDSGAFRRSGLLDPAALNGWEAPQGGSLFSASDLLDPAVLEALPLAGPEPESSDINGAAPAPGSAGDYQAPPLLNAVDLFDPAVLAELSPAGAERERSANDDGPQSARWLFDDAEEDEQPPTRDAWQQPARQATGPIGPIFSLPPLAGPVTPPRLPTPIRSYSLPPDDDAAPALIPRLSDAPDEMEIPSERGWRVVSPSPPPSKPDVPDEMEVPSDRGWRVVSASPLPSRPGSRPTTRPHPAYPPAAYPPLPDPRAAPPRRRERPVRQHRLMWTIGGWLSLLLVLAIIGAAIAYGAIRYFQLEGSQNNASQASGPLPTVAPKAGYRIYRDASLGFSLQYPSGWQEQADKDQNDSQYTGVIFRLSPNAALEVGSSPQYQNWNPAQIDDYVLATPPGITNVSSVNTTIPTASTILIAGLNWTPEDATVTLTNGLTLTMTCLAISYNGRGYAIFFYANSQVFSSYDSQSFEPILLSFRFLA